MLTEKAKLLKMVFKRLSERFISYCCHFNSRGFNIVELMIVVAIVSILVTVAVPVYMSYIQNSRVRALVYPGLHIIETNMGLYYATNGHLPPASFMTALWQEADTTYFHAEILGNTLKITIDSPSSRPKLSRLHDMPMYLVPNTSGLKISTWTLSGTLANRLGVSNL